MKNNARMKEQIENKKRKIKDKIRKKKKKKKKEKEWPTILETLGNDGGVDGELETANKDKES